MSKTKFEPEWKYDSGVWDLFFCGRIVGTVCAIKGKWVSYVNSTEVEKEHASEQAAKGEVGRFINH